MHAGPNTHAGRGGFAIALAAVGVGLAAALAPMLFVPCDFIAFWSSSLVFVEGHNPYDAAQLLPLQHDAGFRTGQAIINFNTPWSLLAVAPLAGLPVRTAFAVWLGLQFALILVSAAWLWRVYGASAERRWVAAALAVGFAPTFLVLITGQFTALTLFGLAGFVYFRAAGRQYLAGVLGALTAIKPHLFTLFAVALAIDAVRTRDGRKVLLAGAAALLVAAVALEVARPGVFAEYRAALSAPGSATAKGMTDYPAPVLGVLLRDAVPSRPIAVQFVPCLLAVALLLALARRLPPGERWAVVVPWLVAASLVVAPYGAWWYDMVLLLPLALLAAVRLGEGTSPGVARAGLFALAALDLALMAMYPRRESITPAFALVPPLVALGCFALIRAARPATAAQPPVLVGAGQ